MGTKKFNNKLIRFENVDGEFLFSVSDVIDALINPKNPRKYWNDIKTRDTNKGGQLSVKCGQLKLQAKDGKKHMTDVLNSIDILDLVSIIKAGEIKDFISFEEWVKAIVQGRRNFILKHKDISVIEFKLDSKGVILNFGTLLNEKHLPVGTVVEKGVDFDAIKDWWDKRAIPASREGIRDLLEQLDISFPQQLLDKSFGLSLSDQYWICPENADLKWENINFFNNPFSEDIGDLLFQKIDWDDLDITKISLVSPDNTSDGVLKKRWKIINGKRYLIKGGSNLNQEVANEVLASRICKRLDIPFVNYEIIELDGIKYSACEDFISTDTELVTAWHIKQLIEKDNNTSDYDSIITKAEELGIQDVRQRIDMMLTLDFIIANTDRHYNNFGFIRNANTLEWIGVAPIYDSGTSMWCKDITEHINADDLSIQSKPFRSKHIKQIKLIKDFSWLNLDMLDGINKEYADILKETTSDSSVLKNRHKVLCEALVKRIDLLKEIVSNGSKE
jgi:hypothetical protein